MLPTPANGLMIMPLTAIKALLHYHDIPPLNRRYAVVTCEINSFKIHLKLLQRFISYVTMALWPLGMLMALQYRR